ncbi:hypothetical protein NDU88_002492 [Pleurodeles waltl]|uniref:Uncharacterized protein n=1 Tax=Pleurodeles waltl TaxID=8319 RepID=A0AAV7MPT7_PLEWA|nr:hypothetical protein NDU88_002492 [Pleurodeles waltl]
MRNGESALLDVHPGQSVLRIVPPGHRRASTLVPSLLRHGRGWEEARTLQRVQVVLSGWGGKLIGGPPLHQAPIPVERISREVWKPHWRPPLHRATHPSCGARRIPRCREHGIDEDPCRRALAEFSWCDDPRSHNDHTNGEEQCKNRRTDEEPLDAGTAEFSRNS